MEYICKGKASCLEILSFHFVTRYKGSVKTFHCKET